MVKAVGDGTDYCGIWGMVKGGDAWQGVCGVVGVVVDEGMGRGRMWARLASMSSRF